MVTTRSKQKILHAADEVAKRLSTVLTCREKKKVLQKERMVKKEMRKKAMIVKAIRLEKMCEKVLCTAYLENDCSNCGVVNQLFVADTMIGYDCETCGLREVLWRYPTYNFFSDADVFIYS